MHIISRCAWALGLTISLVASTAGFSTRLEALPTKHTVWMDPNVPMRRLYQAQLHWYSVALWDAMVLWDTTIERNKEAQVPAKVVVHQAPAPAPVSTSSSVSGHDPCAQPISGVLPSYIVNRESRGQCGAYNAGGCSGRGCIGWAQIDAGHFYAHSPWNPSVPGSCYGLSYNECVNKLSNGGTNLAPWAA